LLKNLLTGDEGRRPIGCGIRRHVFDEPDLVLSP
jgi:hypothetical protein